MVIGRAVDLVRQLFVGSALLPLVSYRLNLVCGIVCMMTGTKLRLPL